MKEEKNLTKNTLNTYKSFAKEYIFFVELNQRNYLQAFSDYINYLTDIKQNQRSTVNNKISALKSFLRFLYLEGEIDDKLLTRLKGFNYRRVGSKVPSFYDYALLKKICLYIKNSDNLNDAEKYFMCLLINHGMTIQECLSIEFKNIYWKERTIIIFKGINVRYIFMNSDDLYFLIRYIMSSKNKINLYQSSFLFQVNGKPMTEYIARKAINKVSKVVERRIKPRMLRNTFIMASIDSGIDMIYIKEYLGLKTFSSLTRFNYLNHSYFDQVREIQNKLRTNTKYSDDYELKQSQKVIHLFKDHSVFNKVLLS